MLEIHIYGPLKKKFLPEEKLSEDSVISLSFIENETIEELLKRLQLSRSSYGELFMNHAIISDFDKQIPDGARIGIFSTGMIAIDGVLYMKKWKES